MTAWWLWALLASTSLPWIYDGQYRVVAEVDASGAVVSRFVYGSQSHSPDYLVRGGVTYAYVKNHLGSLVVGAAAQRLDYDALGNVTANSSPELQPFAGGVYDSDTKLTHFGFRDYDASTGAWTSKDPIRLAGGLNVYAYVANNPLKYGDPTGLWVVNFGLTGAAQLFFGGEISVQISLDGQANLGLSITPNYRVGLDIGASFGPSALWSPTADSIHEMEGFGVGFAGDFGSFSGGICGALPMRDNVSVDWSAPTSSANLGVSLSGGFGEQLGVTFEGGYTFIPISANLSNWSWR